MANYCVILAGGKGTRLWPISRNAFPKQFIQIFDGKSLLQRIYNSALTVFPRKNIFIVTADAYRTAVKKQIPLLVNSNLLCEPEGRSTLPPILWASLKIGGGHILTALHSDSWIGDLGKWKDAIRAALVFAKDKKIIIALGSKPTKPHTGYGQIEIGRKQGRLGNVILYKAVKFHEKPKMATAKRYFEAGGYLWNSGTFVGQTDTFFDACKSFVPDIYDAMERNAKSYAGMRKAYLTLRSETVDNGIMEHAKNVSVVPADFGWSDVGDWLALYERGEKDENNNAIRGRVYSDNAKNNLMVSEDNRLLAVNDVKDLIIVINKDVVFISSKKGLSNMKPLLSAIKDKGYEKHL